MFPYSCRELKAAVGLHRQLCTTHAHEHLVPTQVITDACRKRINVVDPLSTDLPLTACVFCAKEPQVRSPPERQEQANAMAVRFWVAWDPKGEQAEPY